MTVRELWESPELMMAFMRVTQPTAKGLACTPHEWLSAFGKELHLEGNRRLRIWPSWKQFKLYCRRAVERENRGAQRWVEKIRREMQPAT